MQTDLMTLREVADALRVGVHAVRRRYIRTGGLPAVRVGRAWLVRLVDFDAWLRAREASR